MCNVVRLTNVYQFHPFNCSHLYLLQCYSYGAELCNDGPFAELPLTDVLNGVIINILFQRNLIYNVKA